MAIWQKPMKLTDSERWRIVETSDEDDHFFRELCPCTLGHSYEYQAELCAKRHEILNNPVRLAEETKTANCFGCRFYSNEQQPTKFTRYISGKTDVFCGTVFNEFCSRPELQTEASDYNGELVSRDEAETVCADENYLYFERVRNN